MGTLQKVTVELANGEKHVIESDQLLIVFNAKENGKEGVGILGACDIKFLSIAAAAVDKSLDNQLESAIDSAYAELFNR
jgi:hypothetical protein